MFGIEEEGGFGKSAEDIANEYGMTSTRVNQIVRKGKEQLEELLS
jgi:DNA-directed RNA polymerase specialized sigma24 family protein